MAPPPRPGAPRPPPPPPPRPPPRRPLALGQLRPQLVRPRLGRQRLGDRPPHLAELVEPEAARGESGRPDPQPRRDRRRPRVERHGVAVYGDPDRVQPVLRLLAVERRLAQVDQRKV